MASPAIGIHVTGELQRLQRTLSALAGTTRTDLDLFFLLDAPDADTRAACESLTHVTQLISTTPIGAPACFNRLAAATDADVIVFLESGALVGPGWLERLLAALDADPRNGIAGPSTNRAWNEQRLFPDSGDSPADIARTASLAAERFGAETRTLEPLYSLGDFCYAVKREVIDTLGGADEGYGQAPCWEMDFNIRAARAGYRGVFVPGAYVHRMECSERRRRDETLYHEHGKRRYQDKFCALRLRRQRTDYEPHCRGAACEHFAPADLIQIRVPRAVPLQPAVAAVVPGTATPDVPLVTCIMPTHGRAEWVRQAIRYFQRQDYPARELIVVDDGPGDRTAEMAGDPTIRYVRVREGTSIGAKRNRACELARGQFIVQWDDDDWYGPRRLSVQLAPLLAGDAEITGLTADIFLELPAWRFWTCTPDLHRRLFCGDVHGGTLAYHRRVWERLARYPDASLAEDAALLRQAMHHGARLRKVGGEGLFVYVRHGQNAWSFRCGEHVDSRGWSEIHEPACLETDREFYAARASSAASEPAPPVVVASTVGGPLVSCIMPTADRRPFVPRAIRHFLRQDYPDRELIVVDDGDDRIGDLIPNDPRIRYVPMDRRTVLGEKRNVACQHARGSLIAHWDDDDWMADRRLTYQVSRLRESSADVCGLTTLLFWNPATRQAWRYEQPGVSNPWLAGGTLCYTAAHWRANPFARMNVGEDTRFVTDSRSARTLALSDCTFYVALVHPGNTSAKQTSLPRYRPYPFEALVDLMGRDADAYLSPSPAPEGPPEQAADSRRPPLISCIMPTRGRRLFVPQAIRCFLRQDYPRKELLVVDDGDDKVRDLIPADPAVRYLQLENRLSLGAKRNLAVAESRGSIVAHWDDDDWYHPQYLSRSAARLLGQHNPRAVCGLGTYLVWVFGDRVLRLCRTGGIAGATFVYFRSFWEQHRYRDVDNAEDFFLLQDAHPVVARFDDTGLFVVVRHGSHTWQVDGNRDVTNVLRKLPCYGKRFEEIAAAQDVDFYRHAEAALASLAH